MTCATYAGITHGPQLNNYKDLMPLIKAADETGADLLIDHEAFPG